MKKSRLILEELLIALALAVALGQTVNQDFISYLSFPASIITGVLASLLFLPATLVFTWLHEWLLATAGNKMGAESSRSSVLPWLRWYYWCYILLFLPLVTYAIIAIPLALLLTILIWQRFINSEEIRPGWRRWLDSLEMRFLGIGTIRLSWLVAALLSVFYLLVSLGTFAEVPGPAGDEPHYLTFSYSLVTDGDFEMFNNYEQRDYSLWHPAWIQSHTKAGKHGIQNQYPMHNTGLAMLLAPAMKLALWPNTTWAVLFFTRLTIILITALFLALLLQVLHKTGCSLITAAGFTILTGLTVPVLFFSYHIFTEMPVAVLSLFIFSMLLRTTAPGWLLRIAAGIALGFLAFMSVKYILIAASLSLLWLVREFIWGFQWKRLLAVGFTGAIILALFLYQTWHFFGTINPAAYYVGAQGNLFGKTNLIKASHGATLLDQLAVTLETALSFFAGQREALLFYSPWYLMGIAGLIFMLMKRKTRWTAIALLVILLPFLAVYGATGFGGGHSPPARGITSIIWLFVLPAGFLWQQLGGKRPQLRHGLILFSLLMSLILLLNPGFLYHDFPVEAGHTARWLSSPGIDMTRLAPSVNNKHFENWPVVALWCLAYIAIIVFLLRHGRKKFPAPTGIVPIVLLFCTLAWALIGGTPPLQPGTYAGGQNGITVYFASDDHYIDKEAFWIKSESQQAVFFASDLPLQALRIHLRSPAPNDVVLINNRISRQYSFIETRRRTVLVPLGPSLQRGGKHIYRLTIESLGGKPAGRTGEAGGDARALGVEVRIPHQPGADPKSLAATGN